MDERRGVAKRDLPDGTGGARRGGETIFASALGETGHAVPDRVPAPGCFTDLNLDQVVAAATAGRGEYDLEPFFHAPAPDLATIAYRHEIMKDLERDEVLGLVKTFSANMRAMRERVATLSKLHDLRQKEAVFLDAIAFYCTAIAELARNLDAASLRSRGLAGFRRHVREYVASTAFASLEGRMKAIREELAGIEHSQLLTYGSATVRRLGDEPDDSAAVEATFARFKQGDAAEFDFRLPDFFEMNHVEAGILDRVALLWPEIFGRLDACFAENRAYLDPIIGRWERELQFYVAWLDYIRPLKAAGLSFCYPALSPSSKAIDAAGAFDIALARKLAGEKQPVVTNDFELSGPERAFVISGPNQGGTTTFARMFGQMHWLGRLGCPVPGTEAALFLFDGFTPTSSTRRTSATIAASSRTTWCAASWAHSCRWPSARCCRRRPGSASRSPSWRWAGSGRRWHGRSTARRSPGARRCSSAGPRSPGSECGSTWWRVACGRRCASPRRPRRSA